MERDRERTTLIALSQSIVIGIGGMLGGVKVDIEEPFYTPAEWKRITKEREEARELVAEMAQLAKLKRLSREWRKS